MKKYFVLLLTIVLAVSMVGCDKFNKISAEDITIENFSEYFVVTSEYKNIEWEEKEKYKRTGNRDLDFLNGMLSLVSNGNADLCIDIINKEQISGLMVTLEIKIKNNSDGWCENAGYDVVQKNVYITSEEVTSIVIPRTARSFNGETEPNIECVEITVTKINII